MDIKKYIELGRIHTASLTIPSILLSYFLAGGKFFSIQTILFALFALLFHYVGFLFNDYFDYKYDQKKIWKPLIRGDISLKAAKKIGIIGFIFLMLLGIYLSHFKFIAFLILLGSVITGILYNMYSKKYKIIAPFLICSSFTLLILFPYFAITETPSILIALYAMFAFFTMLYQISYSGEYKDMDDPYNILRKLGAKIKNGEFIPSKESQKYAWSLKSFTFPLLLLIYIESNVYTIYGFIGMLICLFLSFYYVNKQQQIVPYKNEIITGLCAKVEIFNYFALVFALSGMLGLMKTLFFILFPITWFICFNYYYWGRIIAPKV